MFKTHQFCLLIVTFFVALFLCDIHIVSPQESSTPIYLVTSIINNGSYQSEIWEYHIGTPKAKRILVLQSNRQTIGKSFSVNELSHLRDYVEQHDYLEKGWAEKNPPKSYTDSVWRFDSTHLLIRIGYEVQDGWARMGDSATRGRFGYYEYLLVDLANVPKVTSFFKMDYHAAAYKDWSLLGTNPFVFPRSLQLNPSQSKLVLLLTPQSVFCPWQICSSILILDYFGAPIQTTLISLATNPVWSPDGKHLAYLHTKCINQFKDCTTNLEVMSTDDGSRETIPDWAYSTFIGWDAIVPSSFEWFDNDNLFYRVFPPKFILDSVAWSFKSYNLTTKSTADFPQDKIDDYAVYASKVGIYYMFEEKKDFGIHITPITLENGRRKFVTGIYPAYNTRFPNRMLLDSFVVFESGNKQTLIDLSAILPKDEWIAAIAP